MRYAVVMWRWVVLLAGCNAVYDLAPTRAWDAAPPLDDTDGDGVPDIRDNCDAAANPTQADADGDLRGDACDDCPLVVNPPDEDIDRDGVGDRCDSHPQAAGDCLRLLDSFTTPEAFEASWLAQSEAGATAVATNGTVVMTSPLPDARVTIVERFLGERVDLVVLGSASHATMAPTVITIATAAATMAKRYGCELSSPSMNVLTPDATPENTLLVPPAIVGDRFVARLVTIEAVEGTVRVGCRIDYGASVAAGTVDDAVAITGPTGISVRGGVATIEAIAVYAYAPNRACATEYR